MSSDTETESSGDLFESILKFGISPKKKIPSALKLFQRAARWIPLSINPFLCLTRVIYAGLQSDDSGAEYKLYLTNLCAYNQLRSRYTDDEIDLHEKVMGLVPGFRDTIEKFSENADQLDTFINLLNRWSNEARHEDTGSIKHTALEYIPRNPSVESIQPPITRNQGKSVRGFNHIATARLLCPYRDIELFDSDPHYYMEQVQDGKIKIKASYYPTFLYDEDIEYDPHEMDKGLCRGHFLIRLYRHIFTGPSSALQKVRKATKLSKAEIHCMTEVTGRTIAYICVQGRNMLSSSEQWSSMDGNFNMETFYNLIVDLFEREPDDPWVVETLAFWNKEVPSLRTRKKNMQHQPSNDSESDEAEAVFAQRRARHARNEIPNQTRQIDHRSQSPEDDNFRRAGGPGSDQSNGGRFSRSNNHDSPEDDDFHHAGGPSSDRSNGGRALHPNNRNIREDDDFRRAGGPGSDQSNGGRFSRSNNRDSPEDDDLHHAGGPSSDRSNGGHALHLNNRRDTSEDDNFRHAGGPSSDQSKGGRSSRSNNRDSPEDDDLRHTGAPSSDRPSHGGSNTHTGATKRIHGGVDGPDTEGEDGHGEKARGRQSKRGRGAKRKPPTRRK